MNVGDTLVIVTDDGVTKSTVCSFANGHAIVEVEGEGFYVYSLADIQAEP